MNFNIKDHWENIYQTKNPNEMSWHQEKPITSLGLIIEIGLDKDSKIIDVGGGDSKLVDNLLDIGFRNISILDVSSKALKKSQQRLGTKAEKIKWICSDIRNFETEDKFDVWHDRALFHFLTDKKDIDKYIGLVRKFLKPGGYLIIAAFSLKGPKKCSGLNIKQYSEDSMKKIFSEGFEHIKGFEEVHNTPFQTTQCFVWNMFRKL